MFTRALDHPILGPKFGPIPNSKSMFFPIPGEKKNPNLTLKTIFKDHCKCVLRGDANIGALNCISIQFLLKNE